MTFDNMLFSLRYEYKWEKVLVDAMEEVLDATDERGIMTFVLSMEEAFESNGVPDLSHMSLKNASHTTAIFQIQESEFKEQLSGFLKRVKAILVQCILSSL